MIYVLYAILLALLVFLTIIVVRTLAFKPKGVEAVAVTEESFDRERAISSLQKLVRCKTVSRYDKEKEDDGEFEKLYALLPELYPNVYKTCELIKFEDRGLLYRWKGKTEGNPSVLMAHYDVVPVNEEHWQKPPFEAIIEDGVMWGRGTLDTKVTFNGILTAAESLIGEGFVPENDVYLAFSGGEEVNGKGALHIVNYFKEKGIELSMVLDEGGAVVEGVFPGVKKPCAMVGIAEKGMLNLEYKVASNGGHASAPKPHTPVGILSRACCNVENKPFKAHIT
ncbi:MAG: M20/M25/M40 family metallo-hydrolase, partial [Clostridia bacterium]|nr:M20/M25/M40 family metallo-hydrolase [Clostridia bacterium]